MAGHKRLRREAGLILNRDPQENDTPSHGTSLGPERPLLVKEPGSGDRERRILRPSLISTEGERLGAGENQRKEEIKVSWGINLMGFYFCFFSFF